jgi:hypothetical protein
VVAVRSRTPLSGSKDLLVAILPLEDVPAENYRGTSLIRNTHPPGITIGL